MSKIKYNYLTNKTDYRYIDYWFIRKIISKGGSIIAEGTEFSVDSPSERKFKLIRFKGNTVQEGTPTPLLPQFVNIATGLQTISITNSSSELQQYNLNLGKNLFNENNKVGQWVNESGIGTASTTWWQSDFIPVKPGSTLTFSTRQTATSGETTNQIQWHGYSTNNESSFITGQIGTAQQYGSNVTLKTTFTVASNCNFIRVGYRQERQEKPQVEYGTTNTDYVEYFDPILLCKLGNYQDYIYKEGETWKIHKEIGKYIFTNSETGSYQASFPRFSVNFQHGQNYTPSAATLALCSHLKVGQTESTNFTFDISNNVIFIHNENCTSLEELNQWFKENNITLYFVLNTPTNTEITNTALVEQLNNVLSNGMFSEGTNTVKITSNDLPGIIHIEA